jgi:c(7)-type cytochrome triheme protein
MKKGLSALVLSILLLSGACLMAAEEQKAPEEYDEDTYGPLAPIIWEKPVKSVVFEHKNHTQGAGLECDSCHDELFPMEAGATAEKEDFTMETLYGGGYCGACHDGETAFASNTRCTTCHIGVRGHARLSGNTAGAEGHGAKE